MFTMKYNSSLACKTKKNRFLLDFNLDNNTQVNYFSQFGEEDYNYGNLAVSVNGLNHVDVVFKISIILVYNKF